MLTDTGPYRRKGEKAYICLKKSGFYRGSNEAMLELRPEGEECFLRMKGAGVKKWKDRTACGLREHCMVRRITEAVALNLSCTLEITRAGVKTVIFLESFLQGK